MNTTFKSLIQSIRSNSWTQFFFQFAVVVLSTFIIVVLLGQVLSGFALILKGKVNKYITTPFAPVARFVANMDWEKREVTLDASMSKAFENHIKKYLWRIDDGTGVVAEDKILKHTFRDPGYYTIKLSIIDKFDQSDVATCTILIPPTNLQQISQNTKTNPQSSQTTENYTYIPEGTFFNYSKILETERTPGVLQSHFIETDCGTSDMGYNTDLDYDTVINTKEGISQIIRGIYTIFVASMLLIIVIFLKKKSEQTKKA